MSKALAVVFSLMAASSLGQQPAVPVFQPPKVTEKNSDPPPKVEPTTKTDPPKVEPKKEQATGIMPNLFVKNRLESMIQSSAGYITVQGVRVDGSRRCWLDPNATYSKKNEKNIVLVTRDNEGFHIVLEEINHQWEAGDFDTAGWLPVKTVKQAGKE